MTGGLLHLVAIGVQDIYLTNYSPKETFFILVYRRHKIKLDFNSKPNFKKKVSCTITKARNLIRKVFLILKNKSV